MQATWHPVCWVSVAPTSSGLEGGPTGEEEEAEGNVQERQRVECRDSASAQMRGRHPGPLRVPWRGPPSEGDSHTCSSSPTSWHGVQWEGRSTTKSQKTGCKPARERRRSSQGGVLPPESWTLWGKSRVKLNQSKGKWKGSENRREWKAGDQAQLAHSQLAEYLSITGWALLFENVHTHFPIHSHPAKLTELAPFYHKDAKPGDAGLRLGPRILIQVEVPMCCLQYIQRQ